MRRNFTPKSHVWVPNIQSYPENSNYLPAYHHTELEKQVNQERKNKKKNREKILISVVKELSSVEH